MNYSLLNTSLWLDYYEQLFSYQHPLSKGLPLMNPIYPISITCTYLLLVMLGKMIMKNQKRFELKFFSLIHNFFLIILSLYMFIEILRHVYIYLFIYL